MKVDYPINLMKENDEPYTTHTISTTHEISHCFEKIVQAIPGTVYQNMLFKIIDDNLSLTVSIGSPFAYKSRFSEQKIKEYCKQYTIKWKTYILAEINMHVHLWSSSAKVNLNTDNILHINNIQLLKEWKKRDKCNTLVFQHLYEMNDDLFSYMLEFL
jgi:hypothetical protein